MKVTVQTFYPANRIASRPAGTVSNEQHFVLPCRSVYLNKQLSTRANNCLFPIENTEVSSKCNKFLPVFIPHSISSCCDLSPDQSAQINSSEPGISCPRFKRLRLILSNLQKARCEIPAGSDRSLTGKSGKLCVLEQISRSGKSRKNYTSEKPRPVRRVL